MNKVEEIKKYKELLDEGILTQAEFDTKKQEILNASKENTGTVSAFKNTQDKFASNDTVKSINQTFGIVEPTDEISPKSKTVAAWLSIIPGMGFAYLENYKIAAVFWGLWILAMIIPALATPLGICDVIIALIFGFAKHGMQNGSFDRFLVDAQGRKLVPANERPNK